MAWTNPKTWAAAVLSVADMNTHVRDNLNETVPAKVTTAGDIVVATGANAIKRVALGTANQALRVNSGATDVEWANVAGALKTANDGQYIIPAGPSNGTTVASAAGADTYGSWVEMDASLSEDVYIIGAVINSPSALVYLVLDIGTGAAASETSIGEVPFGPQGANDEGTSHVVIEPKIPVTSGTRLACRTADSSGSSISTTVRLWVIAQADVAELTI